MRLALAAALLAIAGCRPGVPRPSSNVRWEQGPDLPRPLANTAVAATTVYGQTRVYAMMGLSTPRTWASVVRDTWMLDPDARRWSARRPVPAAEGRLAATAQAIDGRIYLLGGYTISPDGSERSTPALDIYDPLRGVWDSAAAMPTPVDDAVSAVWRDRYLVVVSGWHQTDNVPDVQLFDTRTQTWTASTPIIGPAVFGHAGGIAGDTLVYCDGVAVHPAQSPKFAITSGCYRGELDRRAPTQIAWREIERPPTAGRYRAAAGRWGRSSNIVFAGGSSRAYNYNGIGYDGAPAEPTREVFAYDIAEDRWTQLPSLPEPRMDLRALAATDDGLWLVGGMGPGQTVRAESFVLRWD